MTYKKYKDMDNQCNARLILGDDWGDNNCTFRCQLEPNHKGKHQEKHNHNHEDKETNWVIVEWEKDCTHVCEKHGRVDIYESTNQCEQCYLVEHPILEDPEVPYIDDYMNGFGIPILQFSDKNGTIDILEIRYNLEQAEQACGKELSFYGYNYINYLMEHKHDAMLWFIGQPDGALDHLDISFVDPGVVTVLGDGVRIRNIRAKIVQKD